MNMITRYYRRVGPWPATQSTAFEVVAENPAPGQRVTAHGTFDVEPSMRGMWTSLTVPDDPEAGIRALRQAVGLDGAGAVGRSAVLLADSVSLLRAVACDLGWPCAVDPTRWLDELPEDARIQRMVLAKACA